MNTLSKVLLSLLFLGLSGIGWGGVRADSPPNIYGKCSITVSKMGSDDVTTCKSDVLPTQCISESPGEPLNCSPTGKVKVTNGGVSLSAEFINFFLSAWTDGGDGNKSVAKVSAEALHFPLAFTTLIPVRGPDQKATGARAFITCSLYSESDSGKDCP